MDTLFTTYQQQFNTLRQDLRDNPLKRSIIKQHATMVDQLLKALWKQAVLEHPGHPKISLMATGGYGRSEMFFYSDIDVMFLVGENQQKAAEPLIQLILHALWDHKFRIGHSVRSVPEAVQEALDDITVRTNLLEARRIAGSRSLSDRFTSHFERYVLREHEQEFIERKLQEWKKRHDKYGDSRGLLEPNIKEGKGGHRDLQTLMWLMRGCYGAKRMREIAEIGKISQEELNSFRKARKFLQLVRLHLHDVTNKAEERLSFTAQQEIAQRLGYRSGDEETPNQSVERFMKRYFQVTRMVGQLTRTLCFLLEEEWGKSPRQTMRASWKNQQLPKGLCINGHRLDFVDRSTVQDKPELMIGIFWYLHWLQIDIHPAAWQCLTRNLKCINADLRKNAVAHDYFLKLLVDVKNPVASLKRMNESGVLGRFIPEFGMLSGQMQFDLYHTYTVDEHILTAIGYLHELESGGLGEECRYASTLMPRIEMRDVLYLALFCHDIAKGRGGNHAVKGAKIAKKLATRFGFDENQKQSLVWLVENHQEMSHVAFKRDLDEPQTIEQFAQHVQSLQWLKMLYVMTIADIHAVGNQIWNSWKASLLETLYAKTEAHLGGSLPMLDAPCPIKLLQPALERLLPEARPQHIHDFIAQADGVSLQRYSVERLARLFPSWQAVIKGESFGFCFENDEEESVTNLTIAARDRDGLFSDLSGVLALTGANIVSARIMTRRDGIVIDRFTIQDEKQRPFSEIRRQERIRQRLHQVDKDELKLEDALMTMHQSSQQQRKAFVLHPRVYFDNNASVSHSLIEVQCLDETGLLYKITQALHAQKLSIHTAHIATYGEKAIDVFYVQDAKGEKLISNASRQKVERAILAVLQS